MRIYFDRKYIRIARAHGAVVLHYDHDFELIADAAGQRHEWVVPRGTGTDETTVRDRQGGSAREL